MDRRNPAGSCDACKRRKVKCDATSPCANCRISQLPCERRTHRPKRGRPPKVAIENPNQGSAQPQVSLSIDSEGASRSPQSIFGDQLNVFPADAVAVASTSNLSPTPAPASASASPEYRNHSHDGFSDHVTCAAPARDGDALTRALSTTSSAMVPSSRNAACPSFPSPTALHVASHNEFMLHPAEIFQRLVSTVSGNLSSLGGTGATFVRRCIDLFMQYLFPNTPIVHEATLRSSAALFDPDSNFMSYRGGQSVPVDLLRSFTLSTALCALVTSAIPQNLLPGPKHLTWPFYHASRAMLRLYEEQDIESPHSSSYCIRIWQSAALQNTTGHDWPSWQIHCEATILAVRDRLHDEDYIKTRPRIEAQSLRVSFWLLCLADKTAAAFEACPHVINDNFLSENPALWAQGTDELLLDQSRPYNQNSLESRLLLGFHLKGRLWAASADMIHQISMFARRRQENPGDADTDELSFTKLVETYLHFVGLVDGLPSWLQSPESAVTTCDRDTAEYQMACFWCQRSNIMSVYHCMRMVILQKCLENDIPGVVGLNNQKLSWYMQKLEIGRDFLHEVKVVPFLCFKVQGEPAVERVRRVGGILLEVVNHAPNLEIQRRAEGQVSQLLDILARLDSRASDDLQIPDSSIVFCQ